MQLFQMISALIKALGVLGIILLILVIGSMEIASFNVGFGLMFFFIVLGVIFFLLGAHKTGVVIGVLGALAIYNIDKPSSEPVDITSYVYNVERCARLQSDKHPLSRRIPTSSHAGTKCYKWEEGLVNLIELNIGQFNQTGFRYDDSKGEVSYEGKPLHQNGDAHVFNW